MSKRYFKIETGRYGGELAIGKVDRSFVDYWSSKVEEDGDTELIETLQGFEWDDADMGDSNSPKPNEDFYAWFECDDLEHVNGPFSDNKFVVSEIKLHDDAEYVDGMVQWKEDVDHDYTVSMYEQLTEFGEETQHDYESSVYSREAYTNNTTLSEDDNIDEFTPVLCFISSEKGGFGEVFVETNGEDFDPELLQIGTVETDLATLIESYWYDRKSLQVDFDHADTTGKGFYASVGYVKNEWHDVVDKYISYDMEETEAVKEAFDWLYEDRQ